MNNRVVEWHYAHDADISLGEVHISKVAKIILISLCCLLVVGIGLTIYFRNYIIDSIANPRIQLTTSEKTIEVFDDFNALDYVADADVLNKVEYEINGEVDANTVGTYVIEYISKNKAKTNSATLTVNVVDTTPPTIVLANNGAIQIVRDSDEYNNFNPLDYVLSCSDNYDENPLLSFAPTRLVADEQTSEAKIDFSAVDTANNRTSATLTVFILENYESQLQNEQDAAKIEELQKQLEEQQKQLEEQQKQIDEQKKELEEKKNQPTPTPIPTTNPTDPSKPTNPSQGTQTTDPKPTNPKPTENNKHVLSAKTVTISLSAIEIPEEEDETYLKKQVYQKIANGVTHKNCDGGYNLSPSGMPGIDFQLSPGTYTVTWSGECGSVEQTVIITE